MRTAGCVSTKRSIVLLCEEGNAVEVHGADVLSESRVTDLEGIAGRRHSPTLRASHGIPPSVWFVCGQSLVAETNWCEICRAFQTKTIVPFGFGYS